MTDIKDQCRNKWRSILSMFGLGQHLSGKHGPCPICKDGKDRFRFDDRHGDGDYYCNVCGAGKGMDLVMKVTGMQFAEAAREIRLRIGEATEAPPRPANDDEADRNRAAALWAKAAPLIVGDEASQYLQSRGLPGPYPTALRFIASAQVTDHPTKRFLPAMLALVFDRNGRPVNLHRTYLEGGRKARMESPRKMMKGRVPDGAAIRLGSYSGTLGIAEGIETALAARKLFGVTCWSAIDAGKLIKFEPPADVRELHIFGDNDRKFAGQAAAYALAQRISARKDGPVVKVFIPQEAGTDWADAPELTRAAS